MAHFHNADNIAFLTLPKERVISSSLDSIIMPYSRKNKMYNFQRLENAKSHSITSIALWKWLTLSM
jgi:hypothetical protein